MGQEEPGSTHRDRPAALPTTSYALLGLLTLGPPDVSGYELKQRADATLRFFWVSPAMSQVYSELERLEKAGLVVSRQTAPPGRRETRRFSISATGQAELRRWVTESDVEFPVIKHSVALRLFFGHLASPESTRHVLEDYIEQLRARIEDLHAILDGTRADPALHYPGLVAEWGSHYYASEIEAVRSIADRLSAEPVRGDHEESHPQ